MPSEILVKGKCPKCNAKLGIHVDGVKMFNVIMSIDREWHRITCPRCDTKLEVRAKLPA
jgi:phage FluMu protein Com